MIEQGLESMRQNLVRAVSNEHFIRIETIARSDHVAQSSGCRVRIKPERIVCRF